MDEYGNRIVLVPEAKRLVQDPAIPKTPSSTTLTLPANSRQVAITVNYQGDVENISVELPSGTTAEVIIADENTIEEAGKLYAMDYELSDTERQLYIEINNALAGGYTVFCTTDAVTDIGIYEIQQVPAIDDSGVLAVNNSGLVDVSWNLAEVISGDVKYHLTLQAKDNDEIIAQYPLYENMVVDADLDSEDDGEEQEIYVDDTALTTFGTSVSVQIRLPDNLRTGTYSCVVEPVLNNIDEDDLEGIAVPSNSFAYSNPGYAAIVETPVGITVSNTGNGITRVQWEANPTVYSWDITLRDLEGREIGTTSILQENVFPGENTYIDPLTLKSYIYVNISPESNIFASAIMPESLYETDYTFDVTALARVLHPGGNYYNSTLGYIDMNTIESDLNEGYHVYKAISAKYSGRFIKSRSIKFYVEVYDKDKSKPLFSASLFEENIEESGYSFDLESDLDLESLRQIDMGALTLNTNAMDSLKLLPDDTVERFGVVILSPTGAEILNIPVLTLSAFTQPGNWARIAEEIAENYSELSNDYTAMLKIQQIYNSKVINMMEIDNIHINLSQLSSLHLMDTIESGRYTISLTAYNRNNDKSIADYDIIIRDLLPQPFIDSVTPTGGKQYIISGIANGVATITFNGIVTPVIDGQFEVTTEIDSNVIIYQFLDIFGDSYSRSVQLDEFNEMNIWYNKQNGFSFWPLIMPAIIGGSNK